MTAIGPGARRAAHAAEHQVAPAPARPPVSPATMRQLFEAWLANCARGAAPGEVDEFQHAFRFADPALVRRAIDDYATSGPEFMRLAGLRAMHARLCVAERQAEGSKEAQAERDDADRWLRDRFYEGAGFRFSGETGRTLPPVQIRSLVARHHRAHLDCAFRLARLWDRPKCEDAREVMRLCRAELSSVGYEYVGHAGSSTGTLVIEFDEHGRWYPRAVPPDTPTRVSSTAEAFAKRLSERQAELCAREWKNLQAEVETWKRANRRTA